MAEKPILFSTPMVRAILDGSKTQTRRVLRPQPDDDGWVRYGQTPSSAGSAYIGNATSGGICTRVVCPYGRPGDRLWVRETWRVVPCEPCDRDNRFLTCTCADPPQYGADTNVDLGSFAPWRPSIQMPRWASRITLEVTGVRVERLQEISEDDVEAEGVGLTEWNGRPEWPRTAGFAELWDSLAEPGEYWVYNPWVWVVEFRRIEERDDG